MIIISHVSYLDCTLNLLYLHAVPSSLRTINCKSGAPEQDKGLRRLLERPTHLSFEGALNDHKLCTPIMHKWRVIVDNAFSSTCILSALAVTYSLGAFIVEAYRL